MTPEARLQAVIELSELTEAAARPADGVIGAYFRGHRYIGAKDRVAVAELVYALLRHRARLGWWCEHYGVAVTARARLVALLRLAGDTDKPWSAAQIDQTFSGAQFAPAALDAEERKFLGQLKGHDLLHPNMPQAVRNEVPEAMQALFAAQFGGRLDEEMAALLRPAPLDLRVNVVKAARDAVLTELQAAGLSATPCRYSPWGIRLGARVALPNLPAFREGRVEVQDEGSQLVALLVDAKPGMRVVDFCAGAGGKTLAIAAMMANKGRIIATDVLDKRLLRAGERFRRAGLHNIEARALSSASDPWVKRHKAGFDRVLVDVPCGGSGAWRRNPDARWKQLGPGLDTLLPLQREILASAARLVKPGGRLIYATCSLLDVENREQVEAFLAAHPDFAVVPYAEAWRVATATPLPCTGDFLQLTPARHDTDGFFAAVMVRQGAMVMKQD